jgi:hypothetical protein
MSTFLNQYIDNTVYIMDFKFLNVAAEFNALAWAQLPEGYLMKGYYFLPGNCNAIGCIEGFVGAKGFW